MRGAQSGGVVTFEPVKYSNKQHRPTTTTTTTINEQQSLPPPLLKGIRSRVVNAKRTDLSKKIKQKVIQDNCSTFTTGNIRGYNKAEYLVNEGAGKLVRGFFGHTRFATSSKASFEGTHPHLWSRRREFNVYSFGSASATGSSNRDNKRKSGGGGVVVEPRSVGVENYITHNGDFEFFRVKDKYYDVMVVQEWLEKVLETPMPATVDSGELLYTYMCIQFYLALILLDCLFSLLIMTRISCNRWSD
jgi:hypothetical protein